MIAPRQCSLWEGRTITERFVQYDREHPEVRRELVRLAYAAKDAGLRRIGIRMLWERMRWTFHVERRQGDWKLNDHFTSRYVREIVAEHPDLEDMFERRELRAL